MKKLLICGMLLGLLTGVSVAQRGRAVGGAGPAARVAPSGPIAPNARISPNTIGIEHGGALPNATTKKSQTITPNATNAPAARTVGPDAGSTPDTVPGHVITPDAVKTPNSMGTSPSVTFPNAETGPKPAAQ